MLHHILFPALGVVVVLVRALINHFVNNSPPHLFLLALFIEILTDQYASAKIQVYLGRDTN